MKKERYQGRIFFDDWLKNELRDPVFRRAYQRADLPIRIAIEMAKLREKAGLSQKELAKKINTKQQVVSRIENFRHTNLTIGTLQKAAKALGAELYIGFK